MTLHVEIPAGSDPAALAAELQARLAALSEVEKTAAAPESPRFTGAEVVAAIAVNVAIIKGTGEIADALHQALPKIKRVLQDLELSNATVEVGQDLVPIDEVTSFAGGKHVYLTDSPACARV